MPSSPQETVELSRRLSKWAETYNSDAARAAARHMSDIHAAAGHCIAAIERVGGLGDSPEAAAETLTRLRGWLYDELEPHAKALRGPLDQALADIDSFAR